MNGVGSGVGDSGRPPQGKTFLEKAAIVVAPGSVIFAMLYYLGRTRVNAYYSVFGISVTELGLSTEEFLLASPNATFFPLWILLLAGLLGLMGFAVLDRRLARTEASRSRRRIYRAAAVTGAVLLLFSFVAVYVRPGWYVAPLLGGLGAAAAIFGLALRRGGSRAAAEGPAPGGPGAGRERLRTLVGAVLVAMLTLCVFSGVAWYVHREGRAVALRELREGLDDRPSVRVYAARPVFGIPERLLEKYQPYRYVYDRFAVLTTSSTRYYLVPRTPPVRRLVTVRRDDPALRVEVEQAVMKRGR